MDAKLKKRWVAALRSEKYKQGEGMLYSKSSDKYCCLGVLYRVALGKEPPICGYIPKDAFEGVPPGEVQSTLADKNDALVNEKWSFKRIATWIEKNL